MTPYEGGRGGAVSLTFDDGLASQLDPGLSLLARHGLAATFYVNPREVGGRTAVERLQPWRDAAAAGHEIGNHTLTHPCSWNFRFIVDGGRRGLEAVSVEDVERDVDEAERRLRSAIPDHGPRSFAYPCYQSDAGAGEARRSYVPLIARRFVAGRGRGETANDPGRCDLHYAWSWPGERMSGARMVGLAEGAVADGRWAVFTFHGIEEGRLSVTAADLEELLAFLARHRDRIWTAPVATVAARIRTWRASPNPVE